MGENTNEINISSAYLMKKLKTLKEEYKNFTETSSKTKKTHKKCNNFDDFLDLDHGSPRNLMSALQNPTTRRASLSFSYCSPSTVTGSSGDVWKVRQNDLAKEEIRKERRHAFESGKLRGRRLFEDESEVSYEDDDDYGAAYSVCDDEKNVQVKEVIKEVEKRKMGGAILSFTNGKIMMMLLFVALMVFLLGYLIMGGLFDEYVSEVKVVVLPT